MVLTFLLGSCSWLRRSEALSLVVSIAMGTSSIIMSIPTRENAMMKSNQSLGGEGCGVCVCVLCVCVCACVCVHVCVCVCAHVVCVCVNVVWMCA